MPRPAVFFVFSVWSAVGLVVVPLGLEVPLGGWADLLFLIFASAVLLYDEVKQLGARRAAVRFFAICLIAGGAEAWGVRTGYLFGDYVYTEAWGPLLFGTLPLAVPLAWYILTVPIQRIVIANLRPGLAVPLGALLLVTADLVLDPVATLVRGYWHWPKDDGFYYGVPFHNFVGWFLTGLVVVGVARWLAPERIAGTRARARATVVFGVTVGLFGLTALVNGLWIPAVLGTPLLMVAAFAFRHGWRRPPTPADQ